MTYLIIIYVQEVKIEMKLMNPTISIIIPALNEEVFLPKLLQNLVEQTSQDFEVIVVDAHSEDKTREKAEQFTDKMNIRVTEADKRHLAYQRNFGARQAKGEYLLFLDSDMKLEPGFINELISNIKNSKFLMYLPFHLPYDGTPPDEVLFRVISSFVEMSHLGQKPFTYGPGAVFQRYFFNALGGYDEEVFVYEDHEIVQRAKQRGVSAKLLPQSKIYFSFRRFKKEGRINVLSKYLVATMHLLVKGKVDKEIFTYEMGGSAKYLIDQQADIDLAKEVKKYFEKLKAVLEEP